MAAMCIPEAVLSSFSPRLNTDFEAKREYSAFVGVIVRTGQKHKCEAKSGETISMQGSALESILWCRDLVTVSIVWMCESDRHSFDKNLAMSVIVSPEPRPLIWPFHGTSCKSDITCVAYCCGIV